MRSIPFSAGANSMPPAPTFLALANNPEIISFAGGVPDPSLFPIADLQQASENVFKEKEQFNSAFQYAPSQGLEKLRELISADMKAKGISCSSENILITSGAQQALDLIAKLLVSVDDRVAITKPTFFAAIDTFSVYQPQINEIGFHRGVIDLNQAEDILSKRPKFLYLIPDFQNPMGLSINHEQRQRLLELCDKYGVLILEDAAYTELYFNKPSSEAFASSDSKLEDEIVIYVNTFSKTISPGIRVGWIAASHRIIDKLRALKLSTDVHTSIFNQMLVANIMEHSMDRSLITIRTSYKHKNQLLLNSLKEHMPENCWWSQPEGGLFTWLELPNEIDTRKLLAKSLEEIKVAFVPGSLSAVSSGCDSSLRLSFATVKDEQVAKAIPELSLLIKNQITESA